MKAEVQEFTPVQQQEIDKQHRVYFIYTCLFCGGQSAMSHHQTDQSAIPHWLVAGVQLSVRSVIIESCVSQSLMAPTIPHRTKIWLMWVSLLRRLTMGATLLALMVHCSNGKVECPLLVLHHCIQDQVHTLILGR